MIRQSDFNYMCEVCHAFLSEKSRPTLACFAFFVERCPIINHNFNPIVLELRKTKERQRRHTDLEELRLRRKDKSEKNHVG